MSLFADQSTGGGDHPPAPVPDRPSYAALREAVLSALAAARAEAGDQEELAYRAVELAYLERPVSNERVAERLSVSRSSFYRALRRGTAGIADALVRSQSA